MASLLVALSASSSPENDAYVARSRRDIAAATSKDGKATTPEETKATQDFWRDTAPVMAARDAAAARKDAPAVARADATLATMNQALLARLAALNASAPRASTATPASTPPVNAASAVGLGWDSVYSNSQPEPKSEGLVCPGGSALNTSSYTVKQGRLSFDVVWVDFQYHPKTNNGRRLIHVDVPLKPKGASAIVDEQISIQSLNLDADKPQRTYTKAHVTATFDRDNANNSQLGTGREANIVFHVGAEEWNEEEGSGEGCGEQHAYSRNYAAAPPTARIRPDPANCRPLGSLCGANSQCCSDRCETAGCTPHR